MGIPGPAELFIMIVYIVFAVFVIAVLIRTWKTMGLVRQTHLRQKAKEMESMESIILQRHSEGESVDKISKDMSIPKSEVRKILGLSHIYGIDARVQSVFPKQNTKIKPKRIITVYFTGDPGVVNSNIGTITSRRDSFSTYQGIRKIKGPFPQGGLDIELEWAEGNVKYCLHYDVIGK